MPRPIAVRSIGVTVMAAAGAAAVGALGSASTVSISVAAPAITTTTGTTIATDPNSFVVIPRFSPASGPPGTTITFDSVCLFFRGFPAEGAIVYLGLPSTEPGGPVNLPFLGLTVGADGRTTGTYVVPVDAPPGRYTASFNCFLEDQVFRRPGDDPVFVVTTDPPVTTTTSTMVTSTTTNNTATTSTTTASSPPSSASPAPPTANPTDTLRFTG
jgi:hypothetical protein